jgi:imidazolonepropionase-like amidohydrolase
VIREARTATLGALALVVACGGGRPALVSRPAETPHALVVRNVRVFDAPHARLLDGLRDVVVRDGAIAAIEPPGTAPVGQVELDGRGATLLPGLVDVHTHVGSSADPPGDVGSLPDTGANLAAFLYAGVTTVLDLGNLSPAVFRARERIASGADLGPRLYAAGPVFTAPGGHPAEVLRAWLPWYLRWYVVPRATREVGTPDGARAAVDALVADRPDILKIALDAGADGDVPVMAPETIAAVTAAGHAAGIRTIAHIGSSAEAIAAVRGGVDALAHAPWREEISDAAVAAIAAARVPVVATVSVWDVASEPRSDFIPLEREVASPKTIAALLGRRSPDDPALASFVRAATAAHAARRRNVAKLRAAGVTVLAGSDACNAGDFPGAGLHLEVAKLVEAGMSPGDALRAATWDNARFLAGDAADFGEIAVGKRADLLVVEGDPTARIGDLDRIVQVVLGGRVLQRHRPAS